MYVDKGLLKVSYLALRFSIKGSDSFCMPPQMPTPSPTPQLKLLPKSLQYTASTQTYSLPPFSVNTIYPPRPKLPTIFGRAHQYNRLSLLLFHQLLYLTFLALVPKSNDPTQGIVRKS